MRPTRRFKKGVSRFAGILCVVVLFSDLVCQSAFAGAPSGADGCTGLLAGEAPYFQQRLVTRGTTPAQTVVRLSAGHEWLIEAQEQGNDALLEVIGASNRRIALADHPERRTGTRRAIVSSTDNEALTLRVTGKEHEAVDGIADIRVVDLASLPNDSGCLQAVRLLAAADADYARGQQISLGRASVSGSTSGAPQAAEDIYQRAAQRYEAAQALLQDPADAELRAEITLALAGVRYFDLHAWRASAEAATAAEQLFAGRDPYRHARAQALVAAAWIEMATDTTDRPAPGGPAVAPNKLLEMARGTLRELYAFHRRRREPYDAALQLNNIAVAYSYEGRFNECIAAARVAGDMFDTLGEAPRRAVARQNQALCLWGLGHLPEALGAFNQALEDLKPEPYPQLYLLALSNTALLNYALGHFDESLRLHGRSLELAVRVQNKIDEAQSLYGIGVTYYALGDLGQAREFLERSLAIRTASLDGRGRRASLRALATVFADTGEYGKAVDLDREALGLATAPTSQARTQVQLAIHTALGGHSDAALRILNELIGTGGINDPLIRARARLERAVIERRGGHYAAALEDLALATPTFRRFGSVSDGFTTYLEQARVLRVGGDPRAALAAVGHALERAEEIRTQTANPELRAQLQLPLRPAYDLKLDLLWDSYQMAEATGQNGEAKRIAEVAFQTADGARGRSFADVAAQRYSPELRRQLAPELARRARLYESLAGMRFVLDARLDRHASTDPRVAQYASEVAGLQRQVDTLNNEIDARVAGRRATANRPSVLGIAPWGGDVRRLPADAAVIAYWVGGDAAYCWTLTGGGIHWVRLTDPGHLTETARAFHDALGGLADRPIGQRVEASVALYGEILRPIESWVNPYRRWFFIPDAALDYVPFAALRSDARPGSSYVIANHDVALAPAVWRLLALAPRVVRAPRPSRMLLVSDPIYERSDPRLGSRVAKGPVPSEAAGRGGGYRRLPGTAREAAAIESLFPEADVDSLSGLRATRDQLLHLDWSTYRLIHIASHGYIDAAMPQLSALILSRYDQDGLAIEDALRAADISLLTLDAEVVVFSGCNSALGKEVLNEGMVGITYAALARGARTVISSLWQVPDESGANLMTEFYRHLVRESMSAPAALSASMRSVLDRNPSADPALWAAYQVSLTSLAAGGSNP